MKSTALQVNNCSCSNNVGTLLGQTRLFLGSIPPESDPHDFAVVLGLGRLRDLLAVRGDHAAAAAAAALAFVLAGAPLRWFHAQRGDFVDELDSLDPSLVARPDNR